MQEVQKHIKELKEMNIHLLESHEVMKKLVADIAMDVKGLRQSQMDTSIDDSELWTAKEVADYIKWKPQTARRYMREDWASHSFMFNDRMRRIRKSFVVEWVERHKNN